MQIRFLGSRPLMRTTTACLILFGLAASVQAAVTPEQRAKLQELSQSTLQAKKLYAEGKLADSASKVNEIQQELVALIESGDSALRREAKSVYIKLGQTHGLLELEGADLTALPSWKSLSSKSEMKSPPATGSVSFQADIAPWLISKCGNCHINNRRGQFSLATYNDLMRGSAGGAVLFAGSARGSRLVEVIESGDMPRGGGQVTAAQLASLKRWIDEGAKFDGSNQAAALTTFAKATSATSAAAPAKVEMATGSETVSFAREIAPILMDNCSGCHIAGRRGSGGLRMDTFAQLLRGGDSGAVVMGGDASASLLVKKLRGESGQRMPAGGRPPLSPEQIQLISTWIGEGAKFDGPSPRTNIGTVVNVAWASTASQDELFQRRRERALARWSRVLPDDRPSTAVSDETFVLGNVSPERIEAILGQLDDAARQTKKMLGAPAKQPLLKGGLMVFVLKSRYDYSEFGRMTEQRELPKQWLGHWQADPLDAYGVLARESDTEDKQTAAIALQIASGAYLGSFSEVPTWFAEGVARNLVVSTYRRGDPRVMQWQRSLPAAMQRVENAKTLLDGRLDEETAGLVGMSLTHFMMNRSNRRRFDKLLSLLRDGQTFTESVTAAFAPPETLIKTWLGK